MCEHDQWLRVYTYIHRMAARAYRNDVEAAADIASDCFDIFVRNHSETGLRTDYQAWVGRSISGLKRVRESRLRRSKSLDDEALPLDKLANLSPQQEAAYDAKVVRKLSARLNEREKWAFEILADGGTVRDVMDEMHVGPREALALLHQVRINIRADAVLSEVAWSALVAKALPMPLGGSLDDASS